MSDSGDRPPWLYGLVRDASAQSEPLSVVLLLAITVAGAMAVVAFGSGALADTEQSVEIQRNEHVMTLLDSRGAMVALGEARSERLSLRASGGGTYRVDESSGWLRVEHVNVTDSGADETIYNSSLGAVVYENEDTAVAYEGGGVWRTRDGGTTMVSPPEFHYRDATLTLPIIRVTEGGAGTGAGGSSLRIAPADDSRQVFPNVTAGPTDGTETGAPYDGSNATYVNPVENGTVNVTVHSEHYRGWAEYFRTRTEGKVSTNGRNEAYVELRTAGRVGAFQVPAEGNAVDVRGVKSGHNVSDYSLSLAADGHFNNMHWSMYHSSPTTRFELHVYSDGKCKSGTYDGELDVSIYYWDGGSTYQGWQNASIDPASSPDFSVDCTQSPAVLHADLTGDTPLEYGEIQLTGGDNKWHFGSEIKNDDLESNPTLDQHPAVDPGEITTGDPETLAFVVNHYFGVMAPDFELTVTDGPGGSERVEEGASVGNLVYESSDDGRFITFLHVTENEVEVRMT